MHVAGVYKPGQAVELWVNGVKVKVAEDTTDVPAAIGLSGKFKIGARANNTTQGHWDGQIDEVRLIPAALSQSEIQALMYPSTKYYFHGAERVATRQGDALYYLHADHLGTASLTTDTTGSNGAVKHQIRQCEASRSVAEGLPLRRDTLAERTKPHRAGVGFHRAAAGARPRLARLPGADV